MKAIAVIPARLASTRLPRKMLREIAGKPLIGAVYEAVRSSPLLADVIIATDSEEIMRVCRGARLERANDFAPLIVAGQSVCTKSQAVNRPMFTSMCRATSRWFGRSILHPC